MDELACRVDPVGLAISRCWLLMPITTTVLDQSDDLDIKALAARVLGSGRATPKEACRLAAYVLGDADPARTTAHQHRNAIDIPGNHNG